MTYQLVSVPKKTNGGRTKPKNAKIIIGRINDVKTFPKPDVKGINITEALVMNEGTSLVFIEVTPSTINVNQTTEGDPDNKGVKAKIEFSRPGSDDIEFEEFLENNSNEDLFIIIQYPETGINKIGGYPGNPMQLTAESTDVNEGDTHKITFESTLRGSRLRFYRAALPTIAAVVPPAAEAAEQSV